MRPRGSELSYHHFEPITSSLAERGAEIFGNDYGLPSGISESINEDGTYTGTYSIQDENYNIVDYPTPYYISTNNDEKFPYIYTIIQLSVASGKRAILTINRIKSKNPLTNVNWSDKSSYEIQYLPNNVKIEKSYNEFGSSGWMTLYKNLVKDF
jgi:hypothetical protein